MNLKLRYYNKSSVPYCERVSYSLFMKATFALKLLKHNLKKFYLIG